MRPRLFRVKPAGGPRPRWEVFAKVVIRNSQVGGVPLLTRYRLVQTPLGGIYLHHHHRPDADRDCHDHPWTFASLVLRGGYSEAVIEQGKQPDYRAHGRGSFHVMRLWQAHMITEVQPHTWTLLLVGRKRKDWGFWQVTDTDRSLTRWVPWQQYTSVVGAGPDPFES